MGVACLKFHGENFRGWLKNRKTLYAIDGINIVVNGSYIILRLTTVIAACSSQRRCIMFLSTALTPQFGLYLSVLCSIID